jgi:nucleoside-diphosphate-sugar epimerase
MARAYFQTHGLDVLITRCVNNYGPYQFPEKVIPLFATNLLDGLAVPLCWTAAARAGIWSRGSRTARVTTAATASTTRRCAPLAMSPHAVPCRPAGDCAVVPG